MSTSSVKKESNEECQICLLCKPLLRTSCGHEACQDCLERTLTISTSPTDYDSSNPLSHEEFEEALVTSCPTKGRCPFCRKILDLFQLSSVCGNVGDDSVFKPIKDFTESGLRGLVFQDKNSEITVKFPSIGDKMPSITINREENLREIEFSECYLHEKRNIFSGTILFPSQDIQPKLSHDTSKNRRENNYEVVMHFSSDYRYISHGAIIKHQHCKSFPLDGVWTVRWERPSGEDGSVSNLPSQRIEVVKNSFSLNGETYHISFSDRITFKWENHGGIAQILEKGVDMKSKPDGPEIGELIEWSVDCPEYARIVWKRESKGASIVETFGIGRGNVLLLKKQKKPPYLEQNGTSDLLTYNSKSVYGNIFIQGLTMGVASYHFISEDGEGEYGAYISYESVHCSQWPPLDDGSPVPSRVPFINCSYDSSTRTFRGTIPWFEKYGTSWQGCKTWIYEIVFDSEFICILRGKVQALTIHGSMGKSHLFGKDLFYVNPALKRVIRDKCVRTVDEDDGINNIIERTGSSAEQVAESLAEETISKLKLRLDGEGATGNTLTLVEMMMR